MNTFNTKYICKATTCTSIVLTQPFKNRKCQFIILLCSLQLCFMVNKVKVY